MIFSADNLPAGLMLDSSTGQVTGTAPQAGDYPVTLHAKNSLGETTRPFLIKAGNTIALTPPMGWNSWNCFAGSVSDKKNPRRRRCHGQKRPRQSRLDLHQHRRFLAGQSRLEGRNPSWPRAHRRRYHFPQSPLSRHEGACRFHPRARHEGRPLLVARALHLRWLHPAVTSTRSRMRINMPGGASTTSSTIGAAIVTSINRKRASTA